MQELIGMTISCFPMNPPIVRESSSSSSWSSSLESHGSTSMQLQQHREQHDASQLEYSRDDEDDEDDCNHDHDIQDYNVDSQSMTERPPTDIVLLSRRRTPNRTNSHKSRMAMILARSSPEITALCKSSSLHIAGSVVSHPAETASYQQQAQHHHHRHTGSDTSSVSAVTLPPNQEMSGMSSKLMPPPPPFLPPPHTHSFTAASTPSWTDSWVNKSTKNCDISETNEARQRRPYSPFSPNRHCSPPRERETQLVDTVADRLHRMHVGATKKPAVLHQRLESCTTHTSATTATSLKQLSLHRRVTYDQLPAWHQIIIPESYAESGGVHPLAATTSSLPMPLRLQQQHHQTHRRQRRQRSTSSPCAF